jgi:hypothetical protein
MRATDRSAEVLAIQFSRTGHCGGTTDFPPRLGRFMKAHSLFFPLFLALTSAGCSDDGAEPASDQKDPKCESSGVVDPTLLIDDLEDGDHLVAPVGVRNGGWWVASDGSSTTTPPSDQAPDPERILGGRCESESAMRVTGTGFTGWGAVLSTTFRYVDETVPFDASGFRGITFWARVGEENESPIRAQVQDSSTHLNGDICNPEPQTPDECYNGFGATLLTISTKWQKFELDFSTLTQREGWGYQADAVDTSALYTLEWTLDPNRTFDLWVDDIWFYE